MPHYKDGTEAHVGDVVRGKTYNKSEEVVGVLIEVTPGSSTCNCKVSTGPATTMGYVTGAPLSPNYGYLLIFPNFDYSQCDHLEKVK